MERYIATGVVLDVDVLRAFNTGTGKPLATIDLAPLGAHFLNDLTCTPDGDIYVTDTGLQMAPDGKRTQMVPGRVGIVSLSANSFELWTWPWR